MQSLRSSMLPLCSVLALAVCACGEQSDAALDAASTTPLAPADAATDSPSGAEPSPSASGDSPSDLPDDASSQGGTPTHSASGSPSAGDSGPTPAPSVSGADASASAQDSGNEQPSEAGTTPTNPADANTAPLDPEAAPSVDAQPPTPLLNDNEWYPIDLPPVDCTEFEYAGAIAMPPDFSDEGADHEHTLVMDYGGMIRRNRSYTTGLGVGVEADVDHSHHFYLEDAALESLLNGTSIVIRTDGPLQIFGDPQGEPEAHGHTVTLHACVDPYL